MAAKNYEDIYNRKLEAQRKAVLGSNINEMLEIKAVGDRRIESLYADMQKITGKPVYEDFNFRTGKIMGVLKHILQNPKHRKELLTLTGLSSAYVDLYYQVCGNLPYINTNNNSMNVGRQMDVEATRELMQATGAVLGVLVEDTDMRDLTQDNWDRLYNKTLKDVSTTIEFNAKNSDVAYEE